MILVLGFFPVDNTKVMLGTFGPQSEPYTYVMEEEITPSGILARGSYTSRTRVRKHSILISSLLFLFYNTLIRDCVSQLVDDDGRVHLEINHTFDIRKDW